MKIDTKIYVFLFLFLSCFAFNSIYFFVFLSANRWVYFFITTTTALYQIVLFKNILSLHKDKINKYKKDYIQVIKKNNYLEHAGKILRHDMNSGINVYIPRGISSLKRRLNDSTIKEYKLEIPLRLIEDGLHHTQKIYYGVKEFTNLVRENVEIEKSPKDLEIIIRNYLKNTTYADQVQIGELPIVCVNESLFCISIDNFIRNGLKYNDSESKFIKIKMIDDKTLGIIDNGRGMSTEDFLILSQPYKRKENQKESGTGLGLSISISILREHNFNVSCCVNSYNGTTIKIGII